MKNNWRRPWDGRNGRKFLRWASKRRVLEERAEREAKALGTSSSAAANALAALGGSDADTDSQDSSGIGRADEVLQELGAPAVKDIKADAL
jgi:hypothetical protein